MIIRTGMTWRLRAQMFFGGIAAVIGGIWIAPKITSDGGQTMLAVVLFLGALSVLGAIIGRQDHKL